jgi:HD-GYP domain-containing protein (c-di-GMP phosphodiesterase class II)
MLDATTDDIGRCYAQAKPLSQIREELRQGSGTRYSPDCVALLEDAEFYTTLERDIRQERERIYYKIYQSENATAGQSGKTLPPSTTGYLEDVYSPCSRLPAGRLEYPC